MRAVDFDEPGGPEVLHLVEAVPPAAGPHDIVIDVAAAALNYADILQRRGTYGLRPDVEQRLGLECSGRVREVGSDVSGFAIGDEVCALIPGGAYAEQVVVDASLALPVPSGVSVLEAAALPEMAATVWSNLVDIGGLRAGHDVLVHGGSGGIGSGAIQIARALGARVFTTCGSEEKAEECRALGAQLAINYRTTDFVSAVREATGGRGADLVLDNMGASYLERNIAVAADDGRILTIGLQGGKLAEVNIGAMMGKRLALHATSLRDRPLRERARIMAGVRRDLWPLLECGELVPVVGKVFDLDDVVDAHRHAESGDAFGKTLLRMGGDGA